MLSVLEFQFVGTPKARDEMVAAHLSRNLIISGQSVVVVGSFHEEVRDWRVVARVLTEKFGPVVEFALQGLSKQGIEGLVLAATHVNTTYCESDYELQSLQVVIGLCGLGQILGGKRP